jgi:NDP-sugar pyrophosphorylase family protein
MQAMILAAGLGVRLRPLTDDIPKALVKINQRTLLEITIRKLIENDFRKIVINVHHFSDQIKIFLEKNTFAADIIISDESDLLLNTGGGIKNARKYFDNSPILIHNVDIISNLDLKEFYQYHITDDAVASLCVSKRMSNRYLLFNNNDILCGWQDVKKDEKIISRNDQELNQFAFNGIHILNPELIDSFSDEKIFSVIKAYLKAAETEEIVAYKCDDIKWIDVGKTENLQTAEKSFKEF